MPDCPSTFEFFATPGDIELPGHVIECDLPGLHSEDYHEGQVGGRAKFNADPRRHYVPARVRWPREDNVPADAPKDIDMRRPGQAVPGQRTGRKPGR